MSALTGLLLAQGAQALAGSVVQARAANSQSRFERSILSANARMADLQAEDAERRGQRAASLQNQATKRLLAEQEVAFAAQNVGLGAGSPMATLSETAALGAMDALTIRNNAFREAFGFRAEAQDLRSRAAFNKVAARHERRSTLMTGGIQFLRSAGFAAHEFDRSRPPAAGGAKPNEAMDRR